MFVIDATLETYVINQSYFVVNLDTGILHEIGGEGKRLSKEQSDMVRTLHDSDESDAIRVWLPSYLIGDSFFTPNPKDRVLYEMESNRTMTDAEREAYEHHRSNTFRSKVD